MNSKKKLGCLFNFECLSVEQLNRLKSKLVLYFIEFDDMAKSFHHLGLNAVLMDHFNFAAYHAAKTKFIHHTPLYLILNLEDTVPVEVLEHPLITHLFINRGNDLACSISQVLEIETERALGMSQDLSRAKTLPDQHDFLETVNTLIEQRCSQEACVSVEVISDVLGLSTLQFRTKIKALTFMTGVQYILQYRLKMARVFLEKGEGNVQEIALKTGFLSVSYFSKSFKIKFGVKPITLLDTSYVSA